MKTVLFFLNTLLIGWLLAGCGSKSINTGSDTSSGKIISLAPSITEWCRSLGGVNQLVGITDFCHQEPGNAIPSVGGLTNPSQEFIFKLKPDIILASNLTPLPVVEELRNSGLKVEILPFQNLNEVYQSGQKVATFIHQDNVQKSILSKWEKFILESQHTRMDPERPKGILLFGHEGLYAAGKDSYLDEFIQKAGGINLAATMDSSWPQIAEEKFISMKPEFIILSFDENISPEQGVDKFLNKWQDRPLWHTIPAIKNKKIIAMTHSQLSIPGPEIVDHFESLKNWIHDTPQSNRPK